MENKNGSGIFLGVVSVATLVVAIIGATFAFFSATANSTDNAIQATATNITGTLQLSEGSANKLATQLIPVHAENANFARYPKLTGTARCKDDKGNDICTVYQFTVTNSASVAQTVYVNLMPKTNTFENLHFAAFEGAIDNVDFTVATGYSNGALTAVTSASNATIVKPAYKLLASDNGGSVAITSKFLAAEGSVTYTILVWLQDTGSVQDEQSATFAAGVNVSTGDTTTGVTGVLSAAQPAQQG